MMVNLPAADYIVGDSKMAGVPGMHLKCNIIVSIYLSSKMEGRRTSVPILAIFN